MKYTKKEIEKDLANLITKYKDMLSAYEISESIIGFLTCTAYSVAVTHNEADIIEEDLKEIISENIIKCKKFYENN